MIKPMIGPESDFFSDFRPLYGSDKGYVVHELDDEFRVRLPGMITSRWAIGRNQLQVLNRGRGEVEAGLTEHELRIGQTTVLPSLWRGGVATALIMRLFAVARQHGAETSSGVAFNRKPLGMYAKMVGPENITILSTNAPAPDFDSVMAHMPVQHYNDDYFCRYRITLADLRPEYVITLLDTTIDPVRVD